MRLNFRKDSKKVSSSSAMSVWMWMEESSWLPNIANHWLMHCALSKYLIMWAKTFMFGSFRGLKVINFLNNFCLLKQMGKSCHNGTKCQVLFVTSSMWQPKIFYSDRLWSKVSMSWTWVSLNQWEMSMGVNNQSQVRHHVIFRNKVATKTIHSFCILK